MGYMYGHGHSRQAFAGCVHEHIILNRILHYARTHRTEVGWLSGLSSAIAQIVSDCRLPAGRYDGIDAANLSTPISYIVICRVGGKSVATRRMFTTHAFKDPQLVLDALSRLRAIRGD